MDPPLGKHHPLRDERRLCQAPNHFGGVALELPPDLCPLLSDTKEEPQPHKPLLRQLLGQQLLQTPEVRHHEVVEPPH